MSINKKVNPYDGAALYEANVTAYKSLTNSNIIFTPIDVDNLLIYISKTSELVNKHSGQYKDTLLNYIELSTSIYTLANFIKDKFNSVPGLIQIERGHVLGGKEVMGEMSLIKIPEVITKAALGGCYQAKIEDSLLLYYSSMAIDTPTIDLFLKDKPYYMRVIAEKITLLGETLINQEKIELAITALFFGLATGKTWVNPLSKEIETRTINSILYGANVDVFMSLNLIKNIITEIKLVNTELMPVLNANFAEEMGNITKYFSNQSNMTSKKIIWSYHEYMISLMHTIITAAKTKDSPLLIGPHILYTSNGITKVKALEQVKMHHANGKLSQEYVTRWLTDDEEVNAEIKKQVSDNINNSVDSSESHYARMRKEEQLAQDYQSALINTTASTGEYNVKNKRNKAFSAMDYAVNHTPEDQLEEVHKLLSEDFDLKQYYVEWMMQ